MGLTYSPGSPVSEENRLWGAGEQRIQGMALRNAQAISTGTGPSSIQFPFHAAYP